MRAASGGRPSDRGGRLVKLACAVDLLSARIRLESQDVAVALALRARFGPALPDIRETQRTINNHLWRGVHAPEDLQRLKAALEGLAGALTLPLPVSETPALSRPAARHALQRALRLDESTRGVLGAIANAMAVGAAATILFATPAAAHCNVSGPVDVCTGDISGDAILLTSPPINSLEIHGLTANATPPSGEPAAVLGSNGGGGSNNSNAGKPGGNAGNGNGVIIDAFDPTYSITTSGQFAILVGSAGGTGGTGGPLVAEPTRMANWPEVVML